MRQGFSYFTIRLKKRNNNGFVIQLFVFTTFVGTKIVLNFVRKIFFYNLFQIISYCILAKKSDGSITARLDFRATAKP